MHAFQVTVIVIVHILVVAANHVFCSEQRVRLVGWVYVQPKHFDKVCSVVRTDCSDVYENQICLEKNLHRVEDHC